jgi:hypothetical protein
MSLVLGRCIVIFGVGWGMSYVACTRCGRHAPRLIEHRQLLGPWLVAEQELRGLLDVIECVRVKGGPRLGNVRLGFNDVPQRCEPNTSPVGGT